MLSYFFYTAGYDLIYFIAVRYNLLYFETATEKFRFKLLGRYIYI